jgi:hypothetical protein
MAGGIEFDVSGFMASMDALIASVDTATGRAVTLGAQVIEKTSKESFGPAHSKGTPKSSDKAQSVTGTLRRSIHMTGVSSLGGGTWRAQVAPSTVYARRVELGFHGADSIGRHFDQSAYPFMRPGLDKARDELPAIFEATWNAAIHSL